MLQRDTENREAACDSGTLWALRLWLQGECECLASSVCEGSSTSWEALFSRFLSGLGLVMRLSEEARHIENHPAGGRGT